jgi:hypothetical protein
MRAGPSQEEIRRQNLGALLRQVHIRGPLSRAELTAELGLNRSTIGALVADLASVGLVREALPAERSGAGRPSLVVRPEQGRVFVYAFAVGVDRIVAARVGLGGAILDRRESVRGRGEFSPNEVIKPLAEFARQMQRAAPLDAICIGSGVAVAGIVRRDDGLLLMGPTSGWVHEPLGSALRDVLPVAATWPRSPSTPAAAPPTPRTSSTSRATWASAAASSPVAGHCPATAGTAARSVT